MSKTMKNAHLDMKSPKTIYFGHLAFMQTPSSNLFMPLACM
jgi:hypothetical protein